MGLFTRRQKDEDLREVLDLRDPAPHEMTWEESASLLEIDQATLDRETVDRRRDTVAPSTHQ